MNKSFFYLALSTMVFFLACSSPSDENKPSSNIVYGTPVTYGNETYETVVIGTQTWFKRNLNYNPNEGNSWCYGNDDAEIQANCLKYGRLYDWATAMTICPPGFRIPTNADWDKLINYVGDSLTAGTKLKTTTGWVSYGGEGGNGTDDYGFSALPGGCRVISDPWGGCMSTGIGGHWWSADEYEDNNIAAYYQGIAYLAYVYQSYRGKGFGFSVRCLKN
ncbi:MAG: hypothetical protein LBC75_05985 [Fibromonadaceae bacterium]|jgi:uncharacterized protein (TIGR02145 family)|nr:hypothetical protein [Fibromonadaceae bacterium]